MRLRKENQELREKLDSIPTGDTISVTDLEEIRDRVLNKLKLGGKSQGGKALDAFIKELKGTFKT